jgi:predicted nucleic acid-binding protein
VISLDTNIIQSALEITDVNHALARQALEIYDSEAFCVCPIVRAELHASRGWLKIEKWLVTQEVTVIWGMPNTVWDAAGIAFGKYAVLRRGGQTSRRIVADFLIAAHAEHHQLEMLTFDDTVFKSVFPQVTLLSC